jgi:hypothetical protein
MAAVYVDGPPSEKENYNRMRRKEVLKSAVAQHISDNSLMGGRGAF